MSKINWYINRLRMMSLREIFWRIMMLLADITESIRVVLGFIPSPANDVSWPAKRVLPSVDKQHYQANWQSRLRTEADHILQGKFTYFAHNENELGNPPNWHKDHSANIEGAANTLIQFVDYRDFANFGDCKEVWELNRHHHLVILARAYFITSESQYAEAVVNQLEDWLDKNPYGRGMNWRSPLELGIRLISWVWCLELIRDSGLISEPLKKRILQAVYLHCRDISRKFSQGSSANNHVIGEAAGVFIAASYFTDFKESAHWRQQSQEILEREILAQSFPDGCTREHALGYQLFVIQFFVFSAQIGKWSGLEFSQVFWSRLEKMFEFVSVLAKAGGTLPFFGDRDDGYVLDLGEPCADLEMLADLESKLFGKQSAADSSETGFWLFGDNKATRDEPQQSTQIDSVSYPDSGYHLLQSNQTGKHLAILIDAAELGYESIAAHGHADALSITVRFNQCDIFVDAGTYDYFSYPAWRNYFRSTRAHNTLEVDGKDQSVMQGPFMWGERAECQLLEWVNDGDVSRICASHSGYERLEDPVTHTRSLQLNKADNKLLIEDRLDCQQSHSVAIYFHCAPGVHVVKTGENSATLTSADDVLILSSSAKLEIVEGKIDAADPQLGWYSPGYHQRVPITTIVLSSDIVGQATIETSLSEDGSAS